MVKPIDIVDELPRHKTKVYDQRSERSIQMVVVHTTDWDTDPKTVVKYDVGPNHISKTGCPGSTYHEFIMPGGTIFKALSPSEVSWHAGKYNAISYAVALMYRVRDVPPRLAMKALGTRLGDLCLRFGLKPSSVVGHRELKGTGWFWHKGSRKLRKTCPGLSVNMDLVRMNVTHYMQCVLKMMKLYEGEIDGIWGRRSQIALTRYSVRKLLEKAL